MINVHLISIFTLIFLLAGIKISYGQDNAYSKLSVGDTIPDLIWNKELHFLGGGGSQREVKLSDFEDKLLILDFWATWCGSCIAKFPEMLELKRIFPNELAELLVNSIGTKENVVKIKTFFSKREKLQILGSVVGDTILGKLFPHKTIPHYVWIKNRKVVAVTEAESISEVNIRQVLSGKEATFPMAVEQKDFNSQYPLFVKGNGGEPKHYQYRSLLTAYIEGLPSRLRVRQQKEGMINGIVCSNAWLINLYRLANPGFGDIGQNCMVYETKHPEYFIPFGDGSAWKRKYMVTYDLICPPMSKDSALALMRADMDRYFNYRLYTEQRRMECLVLSVPAKKELRSKLPKGSTRGTNIHDDLGNTKFFYGYPLASLIHELNYRYATPVLDESGFNGNVYLDLPTNLSDEQALINSLSRQGISLKREMRKIEVLVVADKNDLIKR